MIEIKENTEFVFYIYTEDAEDPRFSFWIRDNESNSEVSLYERPPNGDGVWLNPSIHEQEYESVSPTDNLEKVLAEIQSKEGVSEDQVSKLPSHEEYFVSVLFGTVEEDEGYESIPLPVMEYMEACWQKYKE